jgi:hypothetical protein
LTRGLLPIALAVGLFACEGSEIAIFAAAQAGTAGVSGGFGSSGAPGDAPAGAAGATASAPGGTGGAVQAGGGAGGGAGAPDPVCQSTADCSSGYYCSKQLCGDAQGSCVLQPFPDEVSSENVCGCNGITFWNDSLRQWYGISSSTLGPCNSTPHTCMRDQDCAFRDAICTHLLSPDGMCGSSPGPGRCWVIPRDCSTADALQYQVCSPPNGASGPQLCVTKCQAIQSRHPFAQLSQDQLCP